MRKSNYFVNCLVLPYLLPCNSCYWPSYCSPLSITVFLTWARIRFTWFFQLRKFTQCTQFECQGNRLRLFLQIDCHLIGGHLLDTWWHGSHNLQLAVPHFQLKCHFTVLSLDHVGCSSSSPTISPRICQHLIVMEWLRSTAWKKRRSDCVTLYEFTRAQNSKQVKSECEEYAIRNECLLYQYVMHLILDRRVIDFNGIYAYALFAFFVWTLLCICSTLLTFQFQLVEYCIWYFHFHVLQNLAIFYPTLVGW